MEERTKITSQTLNQIFGLYTLQRFYFIQYLTGFTEVRSGLSHATQYLVRLHSFSFTSNFNLILMNMVARSWLRSKRVFLHIYILSSNVYYLLSISYCKTNINSSSGCTVPWMRSTDKAICPTLCSTLNIDNYE